MKRTVPLIALLFVAIFAYGQRKELKFTQSTKQRVDSVVFQVWDENTPELIGKGEYTYDNSYARADLILPYFNDEFSIVEALDIIELFNHKLVSFSGSV